MSPAKTPTKPAGKQGQQLPERRKKWAPRTKNGCRTCRSRHVKCDETKPVCARCSKLGLTCGDYVVSCSSAQLPPPLAVQLAPRHHPPLPPPPPISWQPQLTPFPSGVAATQQELYLFDYLRGDSLADMGDAFNETFWASGLLLAAKHHSVVWHACISFAALSKRARKLVAAEIEAAMADPDTKSLYTLALKKYHISLVHVGGLAAQDNVTPADKSIILIANMLFLLCAISRGDMAETRTLHTKGIELIYTWRIWEPGSAAISHPFSNRHLLLFYIQLNGLFNCLWPNPTVLDWAPAVYSLQRQPFFTITDACLELEMIWTGLRAALDAAPPSPSLTPSSLSSPASLASQEQSVFGDRLIFQSSFEQFKARLQEFTCSPYFRASDAILVAILEMRQILVDILLRVDMASAELCWDLFNPQFEEAIDLAPQPLANRPSDHSLYCNPAFRVTPTLTISLSYIARVCREPRLRRRVINLLKDERRREIMMDSRTTVAIFLHLAELSVQLEERGWSGPDAAVPDCQCVKDVFLCNPHRLSELHVEFNPRYGAEIVARNVDDIAKDAPGFRIPVVV